MHPWVWGRMRLYGAGHAERASRRWTRNATNHRRGGQPSESTVDHHRKASKAAHFYRKSAAHRLHRRLEKILPIGFFSGHKHDPRGARLRPSLPALLSGNPDSGHPGAFVLRRLGLPFPGILFPSCESEFFSKDELWAGETEPRKRI